MALTHKEAIKKKQEAMDALKKKVQDSKIIIFTDYRGEESGMTVKEITNLRKRFREKGTEYRIYKNSICKLVFKELGIEGVKDCFKNPTAIAFGFEDPASTSKVLVDFLKEQKKDSPLPKFKIAYMDGELYDKKQVDVLATLPSRDELLAQLLRTMNGPLQGMVNVMAGVPRAFVTVLDKIREEKEKQS